jgi:hypothetical protein
VRQRRKLGRDPRAERFRDHDAAAAMLWSRAFRGPWRLADL